MGIGSAKASLADEPAHRFFFPHLIQVGLLNMVLYKREMAYTRACYICYVNLKRKIKSDSVDLWEIFYMFRIFQTPFHNISKRVVCTERAEQTEFIVAQKIRTRSNI